MESPRDSDEESSEPESVIIEHWSTFLNDSQFISIMKINQDEDDNQGDKENADPNLKKVSGD